MNSNWSSGYVADLTYSHGYYHELAPSFLRFALLYNGLAHGTGDAGGDYTYCELGYGPTAWPSPARSGRRGHWVR